MNSTIRDGSLLAKETLVGLRATINKNTEEQGFILEIQQKKRK